MVGFVLRRVWALPNSLVGVVLASLLALAARGLHLRVDQGVLEATLRDTHRARQLAQRLPFAAMALGHIVIAVSAQAMAPLRAHEHAHVAQAERWGPLFIPAYLLEGLWQWLRGRRAYADNRFEVQARAVATRYAESTVPGVAVAAEAAAAAANASVPKPPPEPCDENRRH